MILQYRIACPLGIIRFYLTVFFFKIELFTYSHKTYFVTDFFLCCVDFGSFYKKKSSIYTVECKNFETQYLKTTQNVDGTL